MSSAVFGRGLDAYARKARLAPALLVLLPVALAAVAWAPPDKLGTATIFAIVTTAGASILLSEIGRDLGKRKEVDLIRAWNGLPTVRLLRHRDDAGNAVTRERHHRALARLIPGLTLPSPEDEAKHPISADRTYESCVHYLREATRDREKFALLFAENVSYGFRRNLWGMKSAGLSLALLALVGSVVATVLSWFSHSERFAVGATATAINGYLFAFWLLRVTPDWVHVTAIAYAERLLAACDVLSAT